MSTRKIDWKVDDVFVVSSSPFKPPKFRAVLDGDPDAVFSGSIGEIKQDLQMYLGSYMSDEEVTLRLPKAVANDKSWRKNRSQNSSSIAKVIFNGPATIVYWVDGSKTVVTCQEGDEFDPEKGLAMAISKKALGNKGNYCNEIKKWLPDKKVKDN